MEIDFEIQSESYSQIDPNFILQEDVANRRFNNHRIPKTKKALIASCQYWIFGMRSQLTKDFVIYPVVKRDC